jgi:hypothetical protein
MMKKKKDHERKTKTKVSETTSLIVGEVVNPH